MVIIGQREKCRGQSNVTASSYRRWTIIFKEDSKVSMKRESIHLFALHVCQLTGDDIPLPKVTVCVAPGESSKMNNFSSVNHSNTSWTLIPKSKGSGLKWRFAFHSVVSNKTLIYERKKKKLKIYILMLPFRADFETNFFTPCFGGFMLFVWGHAIVTTSWFYDSLNFFSVYVSGHVLVTYHRLHIA